MSPLKLTLALLRIPRLFFSLIFFPFLLSLVLVYVQLFLTAIAVKILNQDSSRYQQVFKEREENNFIRKLIYGSGKLLPDARICTWQKTKQANGEIIESNNDPECQPSRLDVALNIPNISEIQLETYKNIFNGNVERIHICESCQPDIVVSQTKDGMRTELKSIWATLIVGVVSFGKNTSEHYVEAIKSNEDTKKLLGKRSLLVPGYSTPITLSGLETNIVVVLNFALLIVIALWLALKAHRRVLDYFSRSGALLPLVASTGKRSFYVALWYLTLIRVAAFLFAALPLTILSLNHILHDGNAWLIFTKDFQTTLLWLVAIVSSLAFATLVASIAELKHRHNFLSFVYRYIPLLFCALGAILWVFSFIFEGSLAHLFRATLTTLPVIGMTPVMLAPIVKPNILILIAHSVLTLALFSFLLKHNTRWFAAHLEDL